MPHRIIRLIAVALSVGFAVSSCSYMTAQGRREAAYRHYVEKHIRQRQKQVAKAQKAANRRSKHHSNEQAPVAEPKFSSHAQSTDQYGPPMTVTSSADAPITPEPAP